MRLSSVPGALIILSESQENGWQQIAGCLQSDYAALRTRREGLLADLLRRADEHEALRDGHRSCFAAADDTLGLIARAIDSERRCCRFLCFQVTVEPNVEGPIWLELTGPEGTRDLPDGADERPI